MHVETRHTDDDLARLIKRESNSRVATRLRSVCLAARVRIHKEIADDLNAAPRSVQN